MRILFFGDIVGELGRSALGRALPLLKRKYQPDFVIANGENASHGRGLNESHYRYLTNLGIDCITLGNHYHDKVAIDDYIDDVDNLVRPLNVKNYAHGVGSALFEVGGVLVRVTNLLGTAFMNEEVNSPIEVLDKLLEEHEDEISIHIVDYHAESTSEKQIFGHYFDGRVSAVLGTHTHVQTSDMHVLPHGTAFCTDVGMSGELDSVIGFNPDSVIEKIVFGKKEPFMLDKHGTAIVNGVVMDFDLETYACSSITPIYLREENL